MRTCLCRSATRPRETNAGAWLGHGTHPGGLGVHDARDTLCPKPAQRALRSGAQLCVSSIHRLRSGRGEEVRCGRAGPHLGPGGPSSRTRWPSAKGAHELAQAAHVAELPRHPWHSGTSLLGPSCDQHDAPPSVEPVCHRNGAAASPTGARPARERHRSEEPRGGVLLVSYRGQNSHSSRFQ